MFAGLDCFATMYVCTLLFHFLSSVFVRVYDQLKEIGIDLDTRST